MNINSNYNWSVKEMVLHGEDCAVEVVLTGNNIYRVTLVEEIKKSSITRHFDRVEFKHLSDAISYSEKLFENMKTKEGK